MKNVTKTGKRSFRSASEALKTGLCRRFVSTTLIGVSLFSALLSGCRWTIIRQPVRTTAAEAKVTTAKSAKLPYGVALRIDPSVLDACSLERVVDGDTIIVHDPDGNRLRVRLTGIDAPESVAEDESRNTEEGRAASEFLKEFMKDTKMVYLEYDEERTDQYNRTLAYVWIRYEDTYIMVNEVILASGHAIPVYIKPNLKYADDFRKYDKGDKR